MGGDDIGRRWALARLLSEPTRRTVLLAVRRARGPLTRDEVAEATGLDRRLAAFHLDRLAGAGVLVVDFARPPSRRAGPGAGRPAKRYRAANVELDISDPARRYEWAATVLARAVAEDPHDAAAAAGRHAFVAGQRFGERRLHTPSTDADLVGAALSAIGYEPTELDDTVQLTNCPFHALAQIEPQLICRLNREFVQGLLTGLGGACSATLAPEPPNCCVVVHRTAKEDADT
jgi:predicted ArsR family transcriptional regulator